MNSLSDLFVTYKAVDTPTITIPKYTPDITPTAMILYGNIASKVETAKQRTADALAFKWASGGAKEVPYTQPQTKMVLPSLISLAQASTSAKDFIKSQESFRSSRYKDAGGHSIGYGFYGDKYWKGNTITRELADLVLDGILNELEQFFSQFDIWNKLSNNLKTALHSYMYNVGLGHFGANTKMGKALRSGNLQEIHDAISISTSQGRRNEALVRRREQERNLFKS